MKRVKFYGEPDHIAVCRSCRHDFDEADSEETLRKVANGNRRFNFRRDVLRDCQAVIEQAFICSPDPKDWCIEITKDRAWKLLRRIRRALNKGAKE